METSLSIIHPNSPLLSKIKVYKKRAAEIKIYLDKHPHEWGRFQSEFNQEINGIFRDLMLFEKENMASGNEDKVYKLKRFFIDRLRSDFVRGDYLQHSLGKPYGYAGDFKIMDDIYLNHPTTVGFERLYDNYFQMSTICNAVRNRKEDFKRIILRTIEKEQGVQIKILDLASGPCRDVFEILQQLKSEDKGNVVFHCYDSDDNTIAYAKMLLQNDKQVVFSKQNAVRFALKKDIEKTMETNYGLIYSTGLFDYLDYRISVRLVKNLTKVLKPGGLLAISDVRHKFSNPSLYFMEWVADWNLIYRDDDDFRQIFFDAGFSPEDISCRYEQQGLMQYILATKNE